MFFLAGCWLFGDGTFHPMLRRAFRYHVNGALKALPCVGLEIYFGIFLR
jgi:hypothetical protein